MNVAVTNYVDLNWILACTSRELMVLSFLIFCDCRDLSHHHVQGPIPPELGQLRQLLYQPCKSFTYLNLPKAFSADRFSNHAIKFRFICDLVSYDVQGLEVHYNNFSGPIPVPLKECLQLETLVSSEFLLRLFHCLHFYINVSQEMLKEHSLISQEIIPWLRSFSMSLEVLASRLNCTSKLPRETWFLKSCSSITRFKNCWRKLSNLNFHCEFSCRSFPLMTMVKQVSRIYVEDANWGCKDFNVIFQCMINPKSTKLCFGAT